MHYFLCSCRRCCTFYHFPAILSWSSSPGKQILCIIAVLNCSRTGEPAHSDFPVNQPPAMCSCTHPCPVCIGTSSLGSAPSNASSSPLWASPTFGSCISKLCGARLTLRAGTVTRLKLFMWSKVFRHNHGHKSAAWSDLNRGDETLGNSAGTPRECPNSHQHGVLVWCSLGSWMRVAQLAESCFGLPSESKYCLIQQLCFKHDELHLDCSLWVCTGSSTTCLMDICTEYTSLSSGFTKLVLVLRVRAQ